MFVKAKLSAQRQVPLGCAEAAKSIAPQITLSGGRYRGAECRRIDDLASRRACRVKIKGHAKNDIGSLHTVWARQRNVWERIVPRYYIHWRSRPE